MTIRELLKGIEDVHISGDSNRTITGIAYDSRLVCPGTVFVATRGTHCDGHDFVQDALSRGAAAIVFESGRIPEPASRVSSPVYIRVNDTRAALALLAVNYYGHPSDELHVVGITGTNGKTTVSYLIKSVLETWGRKTGLTGTIHHMVDRDMYDATHTTPEAPEYQGLLRAMVSAGCTHVVSEVSSHALALRRIDGTAFGTAVFTNLTRDHLDFHETMESYFEAKKRLFAELLDPSGTAVVNNDDPWGKKITPALKGTALTYGLEPGADIRATEIDTTFKGLHFSVEMEGQRHSLESTLIGLPNVYNILAAVSVSISLGIPWDVVSRGIRDAGMVRGRFERVDLGQDFMVVVDYAHTEDALERLIYTARGLTKGKVITVFGCGGDRDRGKRPVMGSLATRLSDFVIFTSDNPRSEDPMKIVQEIEEGATRKNYLVDIDRSKAIGRAVMMADRGDIVLVAGKGHEAYQEIKGVRTPFDDREVLEKAIRQGLNHR